MKTISARQFRLHFQELTEPVQVQRRRESGEYEIVGTWEPAPSLEDLAAAMDIVQPSWRGTFTPVPKPGKK